MAILIKGMEMPKEGNWKTVRIYPDGTCAVPNWQGDCMLLKGAQAAELPPHGRLIDADAMEKECCHGCKNEFHKYENCIDCVLANAPTIIPASFENPTKNARYSQDNPAEEGE